MPAAWVPPAEPLGCGSLCPPICLSATVPGCDARLFAGEGEALGSLAVPRGWLGTDPKLCACSRQCAGACSNGHEGAEPTARGWHGGAGGVQHCSRAPAVVQHPSPGTQELLAL